MNGRIVIFKNEKETMVSHLTYGHVNPLLTFSYSLFPCSPDEEMALVEHLKGMSLAEGAKCELKSLLICLVMLGDVDSARRLQRTAEKFQLSQIAAVKLAADSLSVDNVDEHAFNLDTYIQKFQKEQVQNSDAFFWKSKVLG